MAQWYVRLGSDLIGPLDSPTLRKLAADGTLKPLDCIAQSPSGPWTEARRTALFLRPQVPLASPEAPPTPAAQRPAPPPLPEISPPSAEPNTQRARRLILTGTAVGVAAIVVVGLIANLAGNRSLTSEQIVAACEKSVAQIKGKTGVGSGFVIRDGIVATNKHVIAGEPVALLEVFFPSASGPARGPFKATFFYEDPRLDLAFLSVRCESPPLATSEAVELRKGEDVIVIGSPGVTADVSLENAVSKGVVSTETVIEGETYRQLGIAINPGNSGGPVLDDRGRVIGVVALKATKKEGLAFCIPLKQLQESLVRASSLSDAERRTLASRQAARSMLGLLTETGAVMEVVMETYADSMQAAIARGGHADDGLTQARSEVAERIRQQNERIGPLIVENLRPIMADDSLPESIRSKLADLATNVGELQSYVDSPRGSYLTYRQKLLELSDTRNRLITSLQLLLGK